MTLEQRNRSLPHEILTRKVKSYTCRCYLTKESTKYQTMPLFKAKSEQRLSIVHITHCHPFAISVTIHCRTICRITVTSHGDCECITYRTRLCSKAPSAETTPCHDSVFDHLTHMTCRYVKISKSRKRHRCERCEPNLVRRWWNCFV